MAKEIKVLKCPQCGSTLRTEIKPEIYQCNNCKTIYYLDNDDININHNYTDPVKIKPDIKVRKTALTIIVGLVFIVIVAIFILPALIFNSSPVPKSPEKTEPAAKREEFYTNSGATYHVVRPATQTPLILNIETRNYYADSNEKSKEGTYLVFFDPLAKKVLKAQKFRTTNSSFNGTALKTFRNGDTYLISNTDIYKLDLDKLDFKDAKAQLFEGQPKLQEGISSLAFIGTDDGLVMHTTEDEEIYYLPRIRKIYTAEAYEKASQGFDSLLPGAKEKTYHFFTESKNKYSNYKLQLYKIRYMDNGAGPKSFQTFLIWTRDYVYGEGYKVCLVSWDMKEIRRILNFTDLTPGRIYYEPLVVYEDDTTLLIRFKVGAGKTDGYKLQRLNIKSGAVEWTKPLADGGAIDKLYKSKTGYFGFVGQGVYQFDTEGNTIKD